MSRAAGRLHLIPGLRTGSVTTTPVEPLMDEDTREFLGLKPWAEKCSCQECDRDAKWRLRWCPGTDHEGGGLACDRHLTPMHRNMLKDFACKPHQHDEPRHRPPAQGA